MFVILWIVYSLIAIVYSVCPNPENYVRQTIPYSSEQVSNLVDQIPSYNDNDTCYKEEECARGWMQRVNEAMVKTRERSTLLSFQYATDLTVNNSNLISEFSVISSRLNRIMYFTGKKFYENSDTWNEELRRMLYLTRTVSISQPEVTKIITQMKGLYSKTKVIRNGKTYYLDPELTNIMASSRSYDELLWAWTSWFNNVGPQVKNLFAQSVDLENQYARMFGYTDLSENWIEDLETDNLETLCNDLYEQIKPFYEQLHAYVRRKLREFYGSDKINSKYIPAHLLGNIWAQNWQNIFDIVKPYKDVYSLDITATLLKNNYTPLKIFKEAENFYTSMGLYPMTPTFWKYSMVAKPNDTRDVDCIGSAYNFHNDFDFRIKKCTQVTSDDFFTIHSLMGFIESYMSYSSQPIIFQSAANSAFSQALGNTIILSVNNPEHFKNIGLFSDFNATKEFEINTLMYMALDRVAFLPFAYLIDKWRWNVFRGNITPDIYNEKWWKMIKQYQGIEPAVSRNDSYFDAGGKYHVVAYASYVSNYMATFLQFQFYKSLCIFKNHTGPLHSCDFYGSIEAGNKFKEMLSLGASKNWKFALQILTGETEFKASAILEYFQPLKEWLTNENAKYPDDPVGW